MSEKSVLETLIFIFSRSSRLLRFDKKLDQRNGHGPVDLSCTVPPFCYLLLLREVAEQSGKEEPLTRATQ